MKKLKLTKIIASSLVVASILALSPIGASAEWKQDSIGWWYTYSNNTYVKGWKYIDGKYYYFGQDGYMKSNTIVDSYKLGSDGTWIGNDPFMISNANAQTTKPSEAKLKETTKYNWFEENGNKYFKSGDDTFATGWAKIDLGTYYFNEYGVLQTGTFTAGGKSYTYKPGSTPGTGLYETVENAPYINTAYSTDTYKNGEATFTHVVPTDPTVEVYELDNLMKYLGKNSVRDLNHNMMTTESNVYDASTNTFTVKKDRLVSTGMYELRSPGTKYMAPAYKGTVVSSNPDVVDTDIMLGYLDGYTNAFATGIITKKPGKATITITANNFTTTYNVVVTD